MRVLASVGLAGALHAAAIGAAARLPSPTRARQSPTVIALEMPPGRPTSIAPPAPSPRPAPPPFASAPHPLGHAAAAPAARPSLPAAAPALGAGPPVAAPPAGRGIAVAVGAGSGTGSDGSEGSGAGLRSSIAGPAGGRAGGGGTGGLDELTRRIGAHRRYPEQARRRGIEGTVVLRFSIGAAGSVEGLTVLPGADPLLEEAAREAVYAAAPLPRVAVAVEVPLVFRLHDRVAPADDGAPGDGDLP